MFISFLFLAEKEKKQNQRKEKKLVHVRGESPEPPLYRDCSLFKVTIKFF
jgi:hypothetical protein